MRKAHQPKGRAFITHRGCANGASVDDDLAFGFVRDRIAIDFTLRWSVVAERNVNICAIGEFLAIGQFECHLLALGGADIGNRLNGSKEFIFALCRIGAIYFNRYALFGRCPTDVFDDEIDNGIAGIIACIGIRYVGDLEIG